MLSMCLEGYTLELTLACMKLLFLGLVDDLNLGSLLWSCHCSSFPSVCCWIDLNFVSKAVNVQTSSSSIVFSLSLPEVDLNLISASLLANGGDDNIGIFGGRRFGKGLTINCARPCYRKYNGDLKEHAKIVAHTSSVFFLIAILISLIGNEFSHQSDHSFVLASIWGHVVVLFSNFLLSSLIISKGDGFVRTVYTLEVVRDFDDRLCKIQRKNVRNRRKVEVQLKV